MEKICPFISRICIKDECIMWKNNDCIIFNYFYNEIDCDESGIHNNITKEQVDESLNIIKKFNINDFAKEFFEFILNEYKKDNLEINYCSNIMAYSYIDSFYSTKGIDRVGSWSNFEFKDYIKKHQNLTQSIINEYIENLKNEKLFSDKNIIKSIENDIRKYYEKYSGKKKFTREDVNIYLSDNKIDLLPESERLLYLALNHK